MNCPKIYSMSIKAVIVHYHKQFAVKKKAACPLKNLKIDAR